MKPSVMTVSSDDYIYAYKIFYLFGAIDSYSFTGEKLELAAKYFPYGLMLANNYLNNCTISNLEAYLVGWIDHLESKEYSIFLE